MLYVSTRQLGQGEIVVLLVNGTSLWQRPCWSTQFARLHTITATYPDTCASSGGRGGAYAVYLKSTNAEQLKHRRR